MCKLRYIGHLCHPYVNMVGDGGAIDAANDCRWLITLFTKETGKVLSLCL